MTTTAAMNALNMDWRGPDGDHVQTSVGIDPSATPAAITTLFNAFAALSEAAQGQAQVTEQFTVASSAPPGTGPYSTLQDRVVTTWSTSFGGTVTVVIPAPESAIFMPDGLTLDTGHALVAPWIAAMMATWRGRSGETLTEIKAGRRGWIEWR